MKHQVRHFRAKTPNNNFCYCFSWTVFQGWTREGKHSNCAWRQQWSETVHPSPPVGGGREPPGCPLSVRSLFSGQTETRRRSAGNNVPFICLSLTGEGLHDAAAAADHFSDHLLQSDSSGATGGIPVWRWCRPRRLWFRHCKTFKKDEGVIFCCVEVLIWHFSCTHRRHAGSHGRWKLS